MVGSAQKRNTIDVWNRISRCLLLLYFGECAIGGSGHLVDFGPLSLRMVLFILSFFASLPAVFKNLRSLLHNGHVWTVVIFGLYYLCCAGVGLASGNAFSFVWADLTSAMSLALLPGFISVMTEDCHFEWVMNVLFWGATALAFLTVGVHFILAFLTPEQTNILNIWINRKSLGGLAVLNTGICRIFFRSQIFLQVAMILGIWKLRGRGFRQSPWIYLSEGILFSAMILSYTRGFWVGLAASAALVLVSCPQFWKQYLRIGAVVLAEFAGIMLISTILYGGPLALQEFGYRFNRELVVSETKVSNLPATSLNPATDGGSAAEMEGTDPAEIDPTQKPGVNQHDLASVKIREETLRLHRERIREKPLFGWGLGENLDEIRMDGKTEYMYLDLTMKVGYLGMFLYAVTFFGFILRHLWTVFRKNKKNIYPADWKNPCVRDSMIIAAYLGVTVTSIFNPFFFNPMGIAIFIYASGAVDQTAHKLN